ncbi:anthranilate synthase component II [Methanoregula sp.]|jgi:anthranilate synthase/aminodeoxychorismate synthase-like glutamine amidotransferase|uniref:anthranilate synthase component II n=1 Tax=Methanoregula sp. TaxID=2052170 RepID=UPI003C1ACA4C
MSSPIVLIVDCYDSFTFNLYQQVGKLGARPVVATCDTPLSHIKKICCDRIILSPGPGTPEDSGVCLEVLDTLSKTIPTLGVCLGHQAICIAFGGRVVRSGHLMHGMTSEIKNDGQGIYTGLPTLFTATRYHSLVAQRESLPPELEVVSESLDDGFVMGVRHATYPIEGVQFHPESILSHDGDALMKNFLYGPRRVTA